MSCLKARLKPGLGSRALCSSGGSRHGTSHRGHSLLAIEFLGGDRKLEERQEVLVGGPGMH